MKISWFHQIHRKFFKVFEGSTVFYIEKVICVRVNAIQINVFLYYIKNMF